MIYLNRSLPIWHRVYAYRISKSFEFADPARVCRFCTFTPRFEQSRSTNRSQQVTFLRIHNRLIEQTRRTYFRAPSASFENVKKYVMKLAGIGLIAYAIKRSYDDYRRNDIVDNDNVTRRRKIDYEKMEPIPLPNVDNDYVIRALQHRRVTLRGRFDHANEVRLRGRENLQAPKSDSTFSTQSRGGFHVLTPFVLSDSGRRILVNRGYVPKLRGDPAKRPLGQIEGEITLNAFVTLSEELNTIQRIGAYSIRPDWSYGNVYSTFDFAMLRQKLKIDVPALFIADKESTIPFGPIGGQWNEIRDDEMMPYFIPIICGILGTFLMFWNI